jgi:dienelactone hydrolase
MAQDTIFSAHRCTLLAALLGALACGGGTTMDSATDGEGASEGASSPAPSNPDTGATPAVTPAETPSTPSAPAAADGSGGGGTGEGVGTDPIMLGEQSPPASSGGSDEGMASQAPSDGAATDEPAAAGDPSATSLVRGADPTRDSATAPGPFELTTLTTGMRDGPDYGSQTLHVPEGVEGPLAAVAIVPGFNTPESSIIAWGPFLASHGIVALTIGTNSPTDSADARARALLDALETLKAENARGGGPLEGKLALDHLGVMGWSVGGGGVLIATSSTPSLKAAITLAAFSPGGQFPNDQVPTLFLAGSADPNAGGQSQGIFASLPATTPKMLFEVEGGPHEIGNDPTNADGEVGRYGLSWLEVFLVGDDRYRQFLEEAPASASDFQQNLLSAP